MPIQTNYRRKIEARRRRQAAAADAIIFLMVFAVTLVATKSWVIAMLCAAVITAAGWKVVSE